MEDNNMDLKNLLESHLDIDRKDAALRGKRKGKRGSAQTKRLI